MKLKTPPIPFYFVRHGQTDWNKLRQTPYCPDDISLNETGLQQAQEVSSKITNLEITQIYSSPLTRAKQTAKIINKALGKPLHFHEGLAKMVDNHTILTLAEILNTSEKTLIVSHGETYQSLLRILNAQANDSRAANCGLYFFTPSPTQNNQWIVHSLN